MDERTQNQEIPPEPAVDWHAADAGQVMEELGTSAEGLSQEEALRRLQLFGLNRLK
jgi:hypothetical protein